MTKGTLLRYAEIRRKHPHYAASCALKDARTDEFVWQNTVDPQDGEAALESVDGLYRLRYEPEQFIDMGDLEGDMFNPEHADTIPGGLRRLEAEKKRFYAQVESDGVWGFIVEKRCAACGTWQHVDSCWGFVGREIVEQEGEAALAYAMRS